MNDRSIGYKIRVLRQNKKFTQEKLAEKSGILGHSSVETTRIYTMESGTEHIKLIQKLGLLRC